MSGPLVSIESSAHWYTRDGRPCHEVPNASKGGMRPATLRDARKLGLLPSVTSVQQVLSKPGLVRWQQEQAILAALTLPRQGNESLDDYALRVIEDMRAHPRQAADLGTQINRICDNWYHRNAEAPPELNPYLDGYKSALQTNSASVLWADRVLVGCDYAGTVDQFWHVSQIGRVLVDIKTTTIGAGFKPYPEWCEQTSAYADLLDEDVRTANLIFDKAHPEREPIFHLWKREEQSAGLEIFRASLTIWKLRNHYYPGVENAA